MYLLKQLYTISSKSGNEGRIKAFILNCLKDMPISIETDEIGNMYITKGYAEKYPCLAAHLDEIHAPCEREVVIEGDKIFTVDRLWNRVGCGADDKNGLWIIVNLLKSEPVLKAASVEGCVYVGDNQLDTLCTIKSREELIGDIVSLLQSPAKNVISALQGNAGQKIAGIVKTLEERNN